MDPTLDLTSRTLLRARLRAADALERLAKRLRGGPSAPAARGEFEIHVDSCGACVQTTVINWRLCRRGAVLYESMHEAARSQPRRLAGSGA